MSTGAVYKDAYLDAGLGSGHTDEFPNTVYIALFTSQTSDSGGGTEVDAPGYGRVAVPNNDANWPVAVNGQKTNGLTITFPEAGASWGTVTHYAIMDAAEAGNFIHHGPLPPRAVAVGESPTFHPGTIVILVGS